MSSKSSRTRRKYFLLDSNQTVRRKPKRARNRFLNTVSSFLLIRHLARFLRGSILLSGVCILMATFVLFAIFSPYFNLKRVTVLRDNPHIDVAAVDSSLEDFYGQNLLFLDKEEAQSVLLETFPEFREVILKEKWPDALEIKINLSPPMFTLTNNFDATFSVMSEDGVILEELADDTLPLIKLEGYDRPLVAGTRFLDKSTIEKIEIARTIFIEELSLVAEEIRLLPLAQELHLVTPKNTAYWLDLQLDITEQLRKLDLAADEIGVYSKGMEHVDLRIPNRIFWKPR